MPPKERRNQRWEFLWERDPHECYICGLPWYGTWTLDEIHGFAKKQHQDIPQGLSQERELDYWKEYVPLAKKKLKIEHKDENRRNNRAENLGLSHQRCNVLKRLELGRKPRRADKFFRHKEFKDWSMNVYERISEEERGNVPTLMKNLQQEPLYRRAALELIRKRGEMKWIEVNNASSERAGCSPVTGRRHLDKLTSIFGPLEWDYGENGTKMVRKRITSRKKNETGNEETER